MTVFSHIDGKHAVFIEGSAEECRRLTLDEITSEIIEAEEAIDRTPSNILYRKKLESIYYALNAALEAFRDLDSAPQVSVDSKGVKGASSSPAAATPAFAQTAALSGGKKTAYRFAGIVAASLKTYLFMGGSTERIVPHKCIVSDQPSDFEELLSECPPDGIGAVRAAARAARMVQELVGQGKNPLGSGKFKKLLVFEGVDNEGRKPKAVFAVYNGRTGESGQPFRKTLPELNRLTADAADIDEYKAAIKALEALGNENEPAKPAPVAVTATQSGARESFSRGAGAVDASETPKATVQFVRVTIEARKGMPHAEGVFRDAGKSVVVAGKTYLTAEQIGEKIASLAEGHPDRAVYEAALKQVKQRNEGLGQKNEELLSAPASTGPVYRPR